MRIRFIYVNIIFSMIKSMKNLNEKHVTSTAIKFKEKKTIKEI